MGSLSYCNVLCVFYNKVLIHARKLSFSGTQFSNKNSLLKQGKIFNKLMGGASKKKRKFIFDDTQTPSSMYKLNVGQHVKNSKENSRRITVLNTLFMKHISDLLVMGNIGADVISKGLEISRVSMNPDFSQLNVFWGCHTEDNIVDLENVLPDVSFTLRHELSQLRIMGVVPRITFVKDKYFSNGAKVDFLLRVADFGEDHVPSELESDFVGDSCTSVKVKPSIDNQSSNETSTMNDDELMPAMRHDVFNLDHQYIMNKILKKMQRSRAIHRFEPNLVIKSDGSNATSLDAQEAGTLTKELRKEALAKFVLSRRILHEKKLQNKHKTDREIFEQELDNEDVDEEDYEVEDYIDDDSEENKLKN